MDAQESQQGGITPDRYREVLGRFPTGVTLVTGMDGDEPLAVVIGSFVSVSMDPPLVGFLTGSEARTWPRIRASGSFCVNVLADDQADLANAFFTRDGDPWEGTGWVPGHSGSPVIPACVASIDCSVFDVMEAGDHLFVVGAVVDLKDHGTDGSPMVFLGGSYGSFDTSSGSGA
ncbi:MAG: flavin reductase family protein [Acidimicrobiia bacterium]|nr:flavin reductase family protein [Actinomycetota bacterium]MBL6924484.1 flavin reductase family protein [Acidimicrobiia bacterium]MBL6926482.1 flavin reductase family protein [Acidimicrobiia bacterium]